MADPAYFLPILYDPTVGYACLKFGHLYRRPRGMYLSLQHKGRVREILSHWPVKDVRVICVSTGGRILGLGDLGANGMGIPIGKLQLYTACAAVPQNAPLPVPLDCGTASRSGKWCPVRARPGSEVDARLEASLRGPCARFRFGEGVRTPRGFKSSEKRVPRGSVIQTRASRLGGLSPGSYLSHFG